jgi:2-methylcitrate dehydratase PrpD
VAGATTLNVAGGMSGVAGTLAPELALAGFTAQGDAVEEALGQLVGAGFSPENLLEDLGARWEITRNYFRLYACCNPIHPALDCLAAALAELRPAPEQIERIEVATYRFASVMRNPDPPNYFASKYSLPHAAATMVVRGGAGFGELDDTALADPVIAALRHRVQIGEDPAMTAVAPQLRPACVTVRLTDGREATRSRNSHRGDFNEPFAETEIRSKFRELAATVLGRDVIGEVERAIDRCEEWASIAELPRLLRREL